MPAYQFSEKLKLILTKIFNRTILLTIISLSPLSTIYAGQTCTPWKSEDNQKAGLIIGTINISTSDIFDLTNPKETRTIHRFADELHKKQNPLRYAINY